MAYVLLVDGDNVNASKIGEILKDIRERAAINSGPQPKKFRLYADFSRPNAKGWKRIVQTQPVDAQQVFSSGRPQAIDLRMTVDGVQHTLEDGPCTLCIASGDRDFSHLILKARERNCKVIVYATNENVSEQLQTCCDEFIHMYCGTENDAKMTRGSGKMPLSLDSLRENQKIAQIVIHLIETNPQVHPTQVRAALLLRDAKYNYKNFKFKTFKLWMGSLGFDVSASSIVPTKKQSGARVS